MDNNEGTISAVKGQRHNAMNNILCKGFVNIEHLIHELSQKTSISTHQVISLRTKNHAHSINSVNHWNAYSSYFKDNLKQELARLSDKAPDVPGTLSESFSLLLYCLLIPVQALLYIITAMSNLKQHIQIPGRPS